MNSSFDANFTCSMILDDIIRFGLSNLSFTPEETEAIEETFKRKGLDIQFNSGSWEMIEKQ